MYCTSLHLSIHGSIIHGSSKVVESRARPKNPRQARGFLSFFSHGHWRARRVTLHILWLLITCERVDGKPCFRLTKRRNLQRKEILTLTPQLKPVWLLITFPASNHASSATERTKQVQAHKMRIRNPVVLLGEVIRCYGNEKKSFVWLAILHSHESQIWAKLKEQ